VPRITESRQPAEPSSAEQKDRYARILRAAARLGAEHGLERMQMHDVAKEAGVAIATLYRYFPSKTDLFVGVLHRQVDLLDQQDIGSASDGSRADAVADILVAASRRMLARPQLTSAMLQSNNAAQMQEGRAYTEANTAFHSVLLTALGVADGPDDEDSRMVRITEQTWYGILVSALNGVIDLEQCELVLRRAAAIDGVIARADGPLDGLVTCAGLSRAGAPQVSVNYFGTTDLVLGLRGVLAASTAPRVALVGSISATQPFDAALVEACLAGDEPAALARAESLVAERRPHEIYSSTKAALGRWLRATSVTPDFAGAGIAVNAIAPGVVLTPMTAELVADPAWKRVMDAAVPMPLNGHAAPETIAHALWWLLSAENSHMAGQVVHVDGGAEALTVAR
jgi:NAD(P)-dependent dehydrogenase (short-subunit alcohol dehydrogenase family)